MLLGFLKVLQKLAVLLIQLYRYTLSSVCWECCRYHPTCSQYALQAIKKIGVWYGTVLCIKRLLRCHPWGGGGYDPIPDDGD